MDGGYPFSPPPYAYPEHCTTHRDEQREQEGEEEADTAAAEHTTTSALQGLTIQQMCDLDVEQMAVKIDKHHCAAKKSILDNVLDVKAKMLAAQAQAVAEERRNNGTTLAAKQAEIDLLRFELFQMTNRANKMTEVARRLAAAFDDSKHRRQEMGLFTQAFYCWRQFTIQARQHKMRLARAEEWYTQEHLKRHVLRAWFRTAMQDHRVTVNVRAAQAVEQAKQSLAGQFMGHVEELRQHLSDAHRQLEQERETRAKLEENMKQAFMRGVCALNIEAVGIMKRAGQHPGTTPIGGPNSSSGPGSGFPPDHTPPNPMPPPPYMPPPPPRWSSPPTLPAHLLPSTSTAGTATTTPATAAPTSIAAATQPPQLPSTATATPPFAPTAHPHTAPLTPTEAARSQIAAAQPPPPPPPLTPTAPSAAYAPAHAPMPRPPPSLFPSSASTSGNSAMMQHRQAPLSMPPSPLTGAHMPAASTAAGVGVSAGVPSQRGSPVTPQQLPASAAGSTMPASVSQLHVHGGTQLHSQGRGVHPGQSIPFRQGATQATHSPPSAAAPSARHSSSPAAATPPPASAAPAATAGNGGGNGGGAAGTALNFYRPKVVVERGPGGADLRPRTTTPPVPTAR